MTWWVGYLEDHPTYRYFLLIGVISHLFISLYIFIFMYIYLFLFKFMYIYLFLFIYISMYLFFLLSFFIFFSYLFIYFFIYLYTVYIYLCIQDTNFRLTTTKLFTSYAPLDDSPKFSSWFWHFARERKTNCWSRWPCCAARHRGVLSSAASCTIQTFPFDIYICVIS
jgi:hypothetical protein